MTREGKSEGGDGGEGKGTETKRKMEEKVKKDSNEEQKVSEL